MLQQVVSPARLLRMTKSVLLPLLLKDERLLKVSRSGFPNRLTVCGREKTRDGVTKPSPEGISSIDERPAACLAAKEVADLCIVGQTELTLCHCRQLPLPFIAAASATASAAAIGDGC